MIIHLVKFNNFPKLEFAASVTTSGEYKNRVDRDGHLEIQIQSGGKIQYDIYDKRYIVENKVLMVSMPDDSYKSKALDEVTTNGVSVMTKIDDIEYTTVEINSKEDWERIKGETTDKLILPFYINLEDDYNSFLKIAMNIVHTSAMDSMAANMRCVGMWFEMVALLDSKTRDVLEEKDKYSSTAIYMKKAKKYIEQNYMKKIRISELANELNITPNYMSKIFKDNTNMTFTEYLNFTRVEKARKIFVYDKKISSEDVASMVGFCDARYLNMMFKKYLGITVHKCRQADNEISFCFVKPWDRK